MLLQNVDFLQIGGSCGKTNCAPWSSTLINRNSQEFLSKA